jgi:hypothetical protein
MDEVLRAVRSLHALTYVQEVQHAGLRREASCIISKYMP